MHTDDDIFESLNIDKKNTRHSGGRNCDDYGNDDGCLSNGSGRDDTIIFEDLDMEDRIFNSALDEEGKKRPSGARKYTGQSNSQSGAAYGAGQSDKNAAAAKQRRIDDLLADYDNGYESSGHACNADLGGSAKNNKRSRSTYGQGSREREIPKELNTEETSVDRKKFKKENERKRQSRIKKIIAAVAVELITLLVIFGYGYFLRNWNLIQRPDIKLEAIENNNLSVEKKEEMEKGYWTVAVFGVDDRGDNLVARGLNSDVIIIANINRETGDIKLVSVFRDSYLNVSEKNTYNKINSAYAMGGPEQALAALNKNLDLNITNYVCFNWKAVADGINILGGVDGISLSKAELYYINAYITETVKVTGIGSYQLKNTGEQHLDGVQAVAYARLRYMDNDFARTERQRNVIKACFQKAKTADFSVLNNIMVTCFPQVATNINFNDIVSMAQNITRYNIADTAGFPWSRGDAMIKGKGDCVIPTTLESNVIKLHEFLFDDSSYTPSDAVLKISNKIKEDSSLYKEGRFIDSVSTDGGVIQKPKTPVKVEMDDDDEDDDIENSKDSKKNNKETIGIDDNGNYIYPTDSDGNFVIPTDSHGNIIYPTDEDGNVIKESKGTRPTDLSGENVDIFESDVDESPIDETSRVSSPTAPDGRPHTPEESRHNNSSQRETTTAAGGPSESGSRPSNHGTSNDNAPGSSSSSSDSPGSNTSGSNAPGSNSGSSSSPGTNAPGSGSTTAPPASGDVSISDEPMF
ncbi:MAG: LCP family protein [Lachnospiraceae bacterium]|nr:LCP family protein [Lachnospiraceae bacterium]